MWAVPSFYRNNRLIYWWVETTYKATGIERVPNNYNIENECCSSLMNQGVR